MVQKTSGKLIQLNIFLRTIMVYLSLIFVGFLLLSSERLLQSFVDIVGLGVLPATKIKITLTIMLLIYSLINLAFILKLKKNLRSRRGMFTDMIIAIIFIVFDLILYFIFLVKIFFVLIFFNLLLIASCINLLTKGFAYDTKEDDKTFEKEINGEDKMTDSKNLDSIDKVEKKELVDTEKEEKLSTKEELNEKQLNEEEKNENSKDDHNMYDAYSNDYTKLGNDKDIQQLDMVDESKDNEM